MKNTKNLLVFTVLVVSITKVQQFQLKGKCWWTHVKEYLEEDFSQKIPAVSQDEDLIPLDHTDVYDLKDKNREREIKEIEEYNEDKVEDSEKIIETKVLEDKKKELESKLLISLKEIYHIKNLWNLDSGLNLKASFETCHLQFYGSFSISFLALFIICLGIVIIWRCSRKRYERLSLSSEEDLGRYDRFIPRITSLSYDYSTQRESSVPARNSVENIQEYPSQFLQPTIQGNLETPENTSLRPSSLHYSKSLPELSRSHTQSLNSEHILPQSVASSFLYSQPQIPESVSTQPSIYESFSSISSLSRGPAAQLACNSKFESMSLEPFTPTHDTINVKLQSPVLQQLSQAFRKQFRLPNQSNVSKYYSMESQPLPRIFDFCDHSAAVIESISSKKHSENGLKRVSIVKQSKTPVQWLEESAAKSETDVKSSSNLSKQSENIVKHENDTLEQLEITKQKSEVERIGRESKIEASSNPELILPQSVNFEFLNLQLPILESVSTQSSLYESMSSKSSLSKRSASQLYFNSKNVSISLESLAPARKPINIELQSQNLQQSSLAFEGQSRLRIQSSVTKCCTLESKSLERLPQFFDFSDHSASAVKSISSREHLVDGQKRASIVKQLSQTPVQWSEESVVKSKNYIKSSSNLLEEPNHVAKQGKDTIEHSENKKRHSESDGIVLDPKIGSSSIPEFILSQSVDSEFLHSQSPVPESVSTLPSLYESLSSKHSLFKSSASQLCFNSKSLSVSLESLAPSLRPINIELQSQALQQSSQTVEEQPRLSAHSNISNYCSLESQSLPQFFDFSDHSVFGADFISISSKKEDGQKRASIVKQLSETSVQWSEESIVKPENDTKSPTNKLEEPENVAKQGDDTIKQTVRDPKIEASSNPELILPQSVASEFLYSQSPISENISTQPSILENLYSKSSLLKHSASQFPFNSKPVPISLESLASALRLINTELQTETSQQSSEPRISTQSNDSTNYSEESQSLPQFFYFSDLSASAVKSISSKKYSEDGVKPALIVKQLPKIPVQWSEESEAKLENYVKSLSNLLEHPENVAKQSADKIEQTENTSKQLKSEGTIQHPKNAVSFSQKFENSRQSDYEEQKIVNNKQQPETQEPIPMSAETVFEHLKQVVENDSETPSEIKLRYLEDERLRTVAKFFIENVSKEDRKEYIQTMTSEYLLKTATQYHSEKDPYNGGCKEFNVRTIITIEDVA